MNVNEPFDITDTMFTTDVPENDHPAWASGTTYADLARVIYQHAIWESVGGANTGNTPSTASLKWNRVSATNRWKALDRSVSSPVQQADSIRYTFTVPKLTDTLTLLDLKATSVRVIVRDTQEPKQVIYDETRSVVDTSEIIDWFTYFTWEPTTVNKLMFLGLPAYGGYELEVIMSGPGSTVEVGEIVPGRRRSLGDVTSEVDSELLDFSLKEKNQYGETELIEKASTYRIRFPYAYPTRDGDRIDRLITRLRAKTCVWYPDEGLEDMGLTIFGFVKSSQRITKAGDQSFATLEIEGLI